ncbi:helix-turn-helix domain-containing protein [Amphritea sp.]|uniref:helix-turn-helix domain-containing protein n=1 Tax=Amphritea sp. TaxID=1872502 RepID=UPI003D10C95F
MPENKIKLITPDQRLETISFKPTDTSEGKSFCNIRLENYAKLPFVDLNLPGMDHHVLIYNYKPPTVAVQYSCGDNHFQGVWDKQSLSVIPAFQDNQWLIPESDSSTLHIMFPHSAVRKVIEENLSVSPDNFELQSLFQTDDPVLRNLSELILSETRAQFPSGNLYMESLANALIVHLLNHYSNTTDISLKHNEAGKITRKGLQKIVEYIDRNLSDKISLEQLAEILSMSSFHFSRSFKESTGYTPHQFLLLRRTYRARQLLLDKRFTPSQIAQMTGFTDQSHLNRFLRRIFNQTASQIRS